MELIITRIREGFNLQVISENIAEFIPDAVAAAITFGLYYLLWRFMNRVILLAAKKSNLDATAASFVLTVVKYVVMAVAVVSSLNQLGVHTGSLLASLGVLGLTIGFAARDALSNIISGIFIFWDRPFVIGDLVEIGGHYGRVEAITMRSTRVVTPDGKMLAIPNTTVVNGTVASYTNFPHLRLDISFTVGTQEDLSRVESLLLKMCEDEPKTSADPKPVVVTTQLNDYNVGMEMRLWIENEREHIALRAHFRRRLFETLRSANVDMPVETLQLQPLEIRKSAEP